MILLLITALFPLYSIQTTGDWISVFGREIDFVGNPNSNTNYGPSSRKLLSSVYDTKRDAIWIFGGFGIDSIGQYGYLNDFWRYDLGTGRWFYFGGFDKVDDYGNYGSKGEYGGWPSARSSAKMMISEDSSEIYLYGGKVSDPMGGTFDLNLDDFWTFSIKTLQWRYLMGNAPGSSNYIDSPPARSRFAATLKDESVHIYGGFKNLEQQMFDDLLKFNVHSHEWSSIVPDAGLSSPGKLVDANMVYSANTSKILLYGGSTMFDKKDALSANLWCYDFDLSSWRQLFAVFSVNSYGIYPEKKALTLNGHPGARSGYYSALDTIKDKLLIFGGYGYAKNSVGILNDLWAYDIRKNQWIWLSGSFYVAQESTFDQDVTTVGTPGGRCQGDAVFSPSEGLFFIFGGTLKPTVNSHFLADLWFYDLQYPEAPRKVYRTHFETLYEEEPYEELRNTQTLTGALITVVALALLIIVTVAGFLLRERYTSKTSERRYRDRNGLLSDDNEAEVKNENSSKKQTNKKSNKKNKKDLTKVTFDEESGRDSDAQDGPLPMEDVKDDK